MKKNVIFGVVGAAVVIVLIIVFLVLPRIEPPVEEPVAEEPAVDPALDPDAVLSYWSMWNPGEPQQIAIQAAIDEWSEATGITVNITWKGREIKKFVDTALAAREHIDFFDQPAERIAGMWYPHMLNLEEFVTQVYPTTEGKPYSEAVSKAFLDMARAAHPDDILVAIPFQPFMTLFMYNKDLFEQAGIEEVPETWAEFLEVCEKLKAAGIIPLTSDDAYIPLLIGHHLDRLVGVDEAERIAKEGLWDHPAVVRMAQDWEEMARRGFVSEYADSNVWPTGQSELLINTAMYLNGTWLPGELKETAGPDFRWGAFAYPVLPDGVTGLEAVTFGSQAFGITNYSEHPKEAFHLIVHLTTGKWDSEIAKQSFGIPVSKGAEWPPQLAEARAVFDGLELALPWAGGIFRGAGDAAPFLAANFTKLIGGTITAEEFVTEMEKH